MTCSPNQVAYLELTFFGWRYISSLHSKTPIVTLWSPCAPRHVMWISMLPGASEFEVRNLISWTGQFAIYVRWLLGWRYISSLRSAEKSQEGLNSCPLLRFCFIGSLHVGVSKRFCRSISLAVYRLSLYIFLTHQISYWSYVGSVHRMRSLAVSGLMTKNPYIASTAIPDPRSPVRLSLGILFTTAQFFLHTLQLANEII